MNRILTIITFLSVVGTAFRLRVTYIYGYNNNLVIAQVINGMQNEVAFTSFESSDKGFWIYNGNSQGGPSDPGRTGIKYYSLANGTVQKTELRPGKYIVSFWARGGNATVSGGNYSLVSETSDITINSWVYHELVIQLSATGTVELNGNIQIDELRVLFQS